MTCLHVPSQQVYESDEPSGEQTGYWEMQTSIRHWGGHQSTCVTRFTRASACVVHWARSHQAERNHYCYHLPKPSPLAVGRVSRLRGTDICQGSSALRKPTRHSTTLTVQTCYRNKDALFPKVFILSVKPPSSNSSALLYQGIYIYIIIYNIELYDDYIIMLII